MLTKIRFFTIRILQNSKIFKGYIPINFKYLHPNPIQFSFSQINNDPQKDKENAVYESMNKILSEQNIKCEGCGVKIQYIEDDKEGYIPRQKLFRLLLHNEEAKKYQIFDESGMVLNEVEDFDPIKIELKNKAQEELQKRMKEMKNANKIKNNEHDVAIQIDDLELLEEIDQADILKKHNYSRNLQNQKLKKLICSRCHKLKHYSQYEDTVKTKITSVDPTHIENNIFKNISKGSTILHLLDISDFTSSLNTNVLEFANSKKCRLLVAVNKIDVLPHGIPPSRIKHWVRLQIQEYYKDIQSTEIHCLSSKSGQGFQNFISYVKKISDKKSTKGQKNFYVIGSTNVGKSSFINRLIKESNRYEKNTYQSPFDREENDEKKSIGKNEAKEKNENTANDAKDNTNNNNTEPEEEENNPNLNESLGTTINSEKLTSSPFPGTTQSLIHIEDLHLGFKIFDTPGIPNLSHISTFMDDIKSISNLLHQKKITPQKFFMASDKSLWIGGLARLDYDQGDEIDVLVYTSTKINLHKTSILRSNEFYIKQFGKLLYPVYQKDVKKIEFDAFEIEIECDNKGYGKKEIEIFGLGWLAFQNIRKREAKAIYKLYIPKNVGYTIRDALIRIDYSFEKRQEKRYFENATKI